MSKSQASVNKDKTNRDKTNSATSGASVSSSKKKESEGYKKQPFWKSFLGALLNWRVLVSTLASLCRLFSGSYVVRPVGRRPGVPLKIYEFEGCPYCRKVREALTNLDLQAIILPCPKGGNRFRSEVKAKGGKLQFPYLVDENEGVSMYESDAIIKYLFKTYGNDKIPLSLKNPLVNLSSSLVSVVRMFRGTWKKPTHADVAPQGLTDIELYSFESSPYSRLVRETLAELELPYLLHNVGKRSPSRQAFFERSGKVMVPYLVDSNKKVKGTKGMFESAEIIKYLLDTYEKK